MSGHLNLWDIFRFIFRKLRTTIFHKIIVVENFFFFKCIQRVKQLMVIILEYLLLCNALRAYMQVV